MIPSEALRFLARAKLRGAIRKQRMRMRTLKGLILTVVGVGIFCLWIGALLIHVLVDPSLSRSGPDQRTAVGLMALFFTLLSMSSALVHRGLYIPREEIERLFAAPVERADLVRYRLLLTLGRSFPGALILGTIALSRLPNPAYAFVGVVLSVSTLPLWNQLLSILSGNLTPALARRLRTVPLAVIVLVAAGLFLVPFLLVPSDFTPGEWFRNLDAEGNPLWRHPAVLVATAPFRPWVRMITARNAGEFLPWFGVCLAIWVALVELTARLPIDFREVSLQTAKNVAERLHRARRGGGAAATGVSRRMARMRVPLLFGTGPEGAIAWRKLCAMVRKAKGTLLVSGLVLLFVTVLSWTTIGEEGKNVLLGPVLIAVLGTVYLCAGLRFDFRDELDRMEVIQAWPLHPRRVFTAMLLPQVCVISGLLAVAIVVRALAGGAFHPGLVSLILAIPPVVGAWVALDNIVFLIAPVRFVPGQEGALQNAGRGALMFLVRMIALGFVAVLGGGPAFAVGWFLGHRLQAGPHVVLGAATAVLLLALVLLNLGLAWIGGFVLARFDVARDRG